MKWFEPIIITAFWSHASCWFSDQFGLRYSYCSSPEVSVITFQFLPLRLPWHNLPVFDYFILQNNFSLRFDFKKRSIFDENTCTRRQIVIPILWRKWAFSKQQRSCFVSVIFYFLLHEKSLTSVSEQRSTSIPFFEFSRRNRGLSW